MPSSYTARIGPDAFDVRYDEDVMGNYRLRATDHHGREHWVVVPARAARDDSRALDRAAMELKYKIDKIWQQTMQERSDDVRAYAAKMFSEKIRREMEQNMFSTFYGSTAVVDTTLTRQAIMEAMQQVGIKDPGNYLAYPGMNPQVGADVEPQVAAPPPPPPKPPREFPELDVGEQPIAAPAAEVRKVDL